MDTKIIQVEKLDDNTCKVSVEFNNGETIPATYIIDTRDFGSSENIVEFIKSKAPRKVDVIVSELQDKLGKSL